MATSEANPTKAARRGSRSRSARAKAHRHHEPDELARGASPSGSDPCPTEVAMPITSPATTATSRIRVEAAFPRAERRDGAPTVAGDRSGVTEATLARPSGPARHNPTGKGDPHRRRPEREGRCRPARPVATVKHHLANARTKVGATTTAQLVWILAPRLPEPAS